MKPLAHEFCSGYEPWKSEDGCQSLLEAFSSFSGSTSANVTRFFGVYSFGSLKDSCSFESFSAFFSSLESFSDAFFGSFGAAFFCSLESLGDFESFDGFGSFESFDALGCFASFEALGSFESLDDFDSFDSLAGFDSFESFDDLPDCLNDLPAYNT